LGGEELFPAADIAFPKPGPPFVFSQGPAYIRVLETVV
jgi:hypothetical protein